jgi:dipeptidyl aminopeptidase/acylaminoacyl peptidase
MALPKSLISGAALAVLALPSAASAAFPGANGVLAFDRGGSILAAPATTLDAGGTDFAPAISPDGTQIAYSVSRDLWVMNADGSNRHAVTTGRFSDSDPAWTPDGKHLVYSSLKGGGQEIWVIGVDGTGAKQLTNTPDHGEFTPAVSVDGRIAYTRTGCDTPYGGGQCVFVMGADGSNPTNLTPEDHISGCESQAGYFFNGSSREPSWSPDGTRIAFTGPLVCGVSTIGSDIWVMGADGSGKTDLTKDDATNDREPAWSPDGTLIAFMSDRGGASTSIFTTPPVAGGAVTQVTSGGADRRPDWGPAPTVCAVPKVVGMKTAAARAALKDAGCKAGTVTRKKAGRHGVVLRQSVKAGARVKRGTKVNLTVGR